MDSSKGMGGDQRANAASGSGAKYDCISSANNPVRISSMDGYREYRYTSKLIVSMKNAFCGKLTFLQSV